MANASNTKRPSQSKDPIDEHDSDTVVAIPKSNMRNRESDASRPETRNSQSQANGWFGSNKRNDSGNLPPRSNQPRATDTRGTPISVRPEQPISAFNKVYGEKRMESAGQKARQKGMHGRFMPVNTLSETKPTHAKAQIRYSSLQQPSIGTKGSNTKRKSNTSVDLSSEDELSQPGPTKALPRSPPKRQKIEASLGNEVNEYQNVQRMVSPDKYKKTAGTFIEPGFAADVKAKGTLRQQREQQRQEALARNRPTRSNDTNETRSPYFNPPRHSTRNARQPLQPLDFKPPGRTEPLTDAASPIIIDSQESLPRGHSRRSQQTVESLVAASGSPVVSPSHSRMSSPMRKPSQRATQPSPNQSARYDYGHNEDEFAWQIKRVHADGLELSEGRIDFVLNQETGALGFRVDGESLPTKIDKSRLIQMRYGGYYLRLHLRGRGGTDMVWLITKDPAAMLIQQWMMRDPWINRTREEDEHIEKVFRKWRNDADLRRNSKGDLFSGFEITGGQSYPSSSIEDHDFVDGLFGASEPTTNGQTDIATSISTKPKLHRRLQDTNGTIPAPLNGTKRSTDGHVVTQESSEMDYRKLDLLKKMKTLTDGQRLESAVGRPNNSVREDGDMPTTSASTSEIQEQLPRTPRVSRSTRSSAYADRDEIQKPKPNMIEKYSKTHGLGPAWSEPLEWPLEAKKRAIVEFEDLERLDEDEFLNDNLVDFALRLLRDQARDPPNIYWFNTYFFSILTKCKGKRINYDAVKKWTKDVDLFSYDYVIVPINENYHWYLAIICNLPALKKVAEAEVIEDTQEDVQYCKATTNSTHVNNGSSSLYHPSSKVATPNGYTHDDTAKDVSDGINTDKKEDQTEEVSKSKGRIRNPALPTIITLDSLGQSHSPAIAALKTYLKEEARQRLDLDWEKDDLVGMTAKGIPCQENFSDCGLYVVAYIAMMLQGPKWFVERLLTKAFDAEKDWAPLRPNHMRRRLRRLIRKLHKQQMKAKYPEWSDNLFEAESSDFSDTFDGLKPPRSKTLPMQSGTWLSKRSLGDKVLDDYGHEIDRTLAGRIPPVSPGHPVKSSGTLVSTSPNLGQSTIPPFSPPRHQPDSSVVIPVKKFTPTGQIKDDRVIRETPSAERGFKDDDQSGEVASPDKRKKVSFPYFPSHDGMLDRHRAWPH